MAIFLLTCIVHGPPMTAHVSSFLGRNVHRAQGYVVYRAWKRNATCTVHGYFLLTRIMHAPRPPPHDGPRGSCLGRLCASCTGVCRVPCMEKMLRAPCMAIFC